jgi:hypothetical protein
VSAAAAPGPYHCNSHGATHVCADSWRVFCVVTLVFRLLRKARLPSHTGGFVFRKQKAIARPRQLFAGLSTRGLDFDSIPIFVWFLAMKVAVRHVRPRVALYSPACVFVPLLSPH